jgi:hypothetical protein
MAAAAVCECVGEKRNGYKQPKHKKKKKNSQGNQTMY